MRKTTKGFLFFAMMLCLWAFQPNTAQAQQKIAYVDAEAIIQAMPEYKSAQSELEQYGRQLQRRLEDQQKEMEAYYTDIMTKAQQGLLTPVQEQEAQAKLAEMQQSLQEEALKADQQLIEKEQSLTEPIYDKFDAALKSVATSSGYTYIVDKKLFLYSGGTDATSQVKRQLGI